MFRARIKEPSEGTPAGPWLRTGDLGAISDGELFIMGRLKDLLIVDGRNHYPDDIEATIREITGGRVAAIAIEDDSSEKLVAIVEVKPAPQLDSVKHEVARAVWKSHNLRVADLVLVSPGSIPITTSGKIRRSSCAELLSRGRIPTLGHRRMTSWADEAGLRHWLVDYLVTTIGCSPDDVHLDAPLNELGDRLP